MWSGTDDAPQVAARPPAPFDLRKLAWMYIFGLAIACAAAVIVFGVILKMTGNARYTGDFTVFWAAAKVPIGHVYDWSVLEVSQLDTIGEVGPFAYPPTTLLLLKPVRLLPFLPAVLLWVAISLAAFVAAARSVVGWKQLGLSLLSPAIVIAAVTGQVSLIAGALIIAGLASDRPWLRGLLIGLAAAIKPQLVFLFPIAFAAARDWRALAFALLAGAAAIAATLLLWGAQPWLDWIAALPGFEQVLRDTGIGRRSVTPASLGIPLGIEWPLTLAGIAAGSFLVWTVFRNNTPALDRLAALTCGCFIALPYALSYDMSALVIAAVPMLLNRNGSILSWAGAAMVFSTTLAQVGLLLVAFDLYRRAAAPSPRPEQG